MGSAEECFHLDPGKALQPLNAWHLAPSTEAAAVSEQSHVPGVKGKAGLLRGNGLGL